MDYVGNANSASDAPMGDMALNPAAADFTEQARMLASTDDGDRPQRPSLPSAAAPGAGAGATQLIPDANNVVVLPDGATLDNLVVRGRDLVIETADGHIYIIPNGAVFVPEIVAQGVTVPPLNLAALLIGNEPQPAAGPVRSSGGNFEVQVNPLQDAYDLGNLLPYTELAFPEPRAQEIIPPKIDRPVTTIIITPDQPAGAVDATASVNEAGLPARGAEPAGSNSSANSETTTGSIVFQAPDGLTSILLNGVAITAVGQTFTTARGVLTITSIAPGNYGYSYTLTDNTSGDNTSDDFQVVVTDADGDAATATLAIRIIDDVPTARNDTDTVPAANYSAQTGNVVTGVGTTSGAAGADTVGADNATLTRIASNNVPANTDTTFDGSGNLVVAGQYGTLTIKADGSYSYVRATGTPGGVTDVFTYTLTDGDTDTSTATLTINITDSPATVVTLPTSEGSTIVFEAGLPPRGSEAPGSNEPAPIENASGTITVSAPDGIASVQINGVTVTGPGQIITMPTGTFTVTSFNAATGTVGYTFTLTDNTSGNSTSQVVNVTVTDIDGDSDTKPFTITIIDDVPTARADTDAIASGTYGPETGNVMTGTGTTSGAAGADTKGADGAAVTGIVGAAAGTVGGSTAGAYGTLTLNADGSYSYVRSAGSPGGVSDVFTYTITDGDGDTSTTTLTIAIGDAQPLTGENATVLLDDDALAGGNAGGIGDDPNAANTSGTLAASGGDGPLTWALSTSGAPAGFSYVANGTGIDVFQGTTKVMAVTLNAATGAYTVSQLAPIVHAAGADENNQGFILNYTATDVDGDSASGSLSVNVDDDTPVVANDTDTLLAGSTGPATGNVLTGAGSDGNPAGADSVGADGGSVTAITGFGGAGAIGGTTTGQYGTLTLGANGSYSYTRSGSGPINATDTFTYTVTDGDGDTATATLIITLADAGPSTGENATVLLDDDALAGGNAGGIGDDPNAANTSSTLSGLGGDGALTWALSTAGAPAGFSYVANGTGIDVFQGTTKVMAVTLNAATGAYTVTQLAPIVHAAGGDENNQGFTLGYTVTDADGDSAPGTLAISVDDDTPTAANDTDAVTEDGPLTASGNVLTGVGSDGNPAGADSIGADGPAAGGAVTAIAGGTVGSALAGTYGSITLNANGTYTYTLNNALPAVQGLDTGEALSDTFTYTITDKDGDPATATLTITINGTNDAPVVLPGTVAVSEEGLALANPDATGTPDTTNSATATGTIMATDVDGETLTYTLGTPATALTSNGVAIIWTGAGTGTLTGSAGATPVITVTIDASGNYTVTLLAHIDHPTANVEDSLDLVVPVNVSDGTATTSTTLTVGIQDDSPIALAGTVSGTVDEDGLAGGNLGGIGDVAGAALTATGSVTSLFSAGADKPLTYGLSASTAGLTAQGLTSGGVALTYAVAGNVVTAKAGTTTVFTLSLDATTGAWTFTLAAKLDHAPGANENDLLVQLGSLLTATDSDGDPVAATGNLTITIDDDTPVLANDTDAVAGGSLGPAVGNVLTGVGSDGNPAGADSVGADGGAVTGITGFGGTGTIGGTTTGQYGTLTLNANGSYSYTRNSGTPGNVTDTFTYTVTDGDGDTATATLTISIADATPFTGPNLTVLLDDDALAGGNLGGIGDVNPDTANTSSTLSGSGGDGALTWALSNTGAPAGFTYVANGTGIDVFQGATKVIAITLNAATGAYTVSQLAPIMHAAGGNENDQPFSLTYTVTDADGDSVPGTLAISVNDDTPVVTATGTQPVLTVDETTLTTNASASFAGVFAPAFGADGAAASGSLVYTLGAVAGPSGLIDVATGEAVNLVMNGGVVEGRTATTNQLVFTVSVDAGGTVTLDQIRALQHSPDTGPNQSATLSGDNLITLTATATDKDGDTASATANIGQNLSFLDDAPSLTAAPTQPTLTVDETTLTTNASASFAGVFTPNYGADGAGTVGNFTLGATAGPSGLIDVATGEAVNLVMNGGVVEGRTATTNQLVFTVSVDAGGTVTLDQIRALQHSPDTGPNQAVSLSGDALITLSATVTDKDGDTSIATANIGQNLSFLDDAPSITAATTQPVLTVDETTLTTNASASFAGVFTPNYGADGAGTVGNFTLGATAGPSGLIDVATGEAVNLVMNGGVVEGRTATTNQLVFTVSVNAGGTVTLDQIRALTHPDATNPNDPVSLSADNLITLTATATDKDGDTASATANIGQNLSFLDDGPSIAAAATQPTLTVDETTLLVNASASFAGVFTPNYGADGAGTVGNFTLGATAGPSGLIDVATGEAVNLVMNGGVVEGRTATTNQLVFTVSVNAGGTVTLDQIRALTHPDATNPNDPVTLSGDNLITLSATVTDKDGDTSTATASIGQNLSFLDDGPSIAAAATQPVLTVDETTLATNASASFAGVFTATYGADGAGTVGNFTLGATAGPSGLVDVATGEAVNLVMNGGVVEGRTATTNQLVFTVSVDAGGTVTLDQIRALSHPDATNPNDPVSLSADNLITLSATVTDKDGDTATATASIGQNLSFLDDGPSIAAAATQPSLTVDETVLATNATASFASVFTTSFGADGAAAGGGLTYNLGVVAGASGLIDTLSGQVVNLVLNGTTVEGRTAGSNLLVFTVTVAANGDVTLDQSRAVFHTPDTGPNQSTTLSADNLITLTATATDKDGDTTSAVASIGQNLSFLDDAPTIGAVTTPLAIVNGGTVSNTGNFVFSTGSDGPAAGDDAIKDVTFSGTVNGIPVTASSITPVSETATTATYNFSFTYATGSSTTATDTGVLTFDKVAGTYTVDLANPIQGISTSGTANGQAFIGYEANSATTDGSQPAVAVTQITTSLFVQFTSIAEPGSGTGANNLNTVNYNLDGTPANDGTPLTFSNGELFNQAASWVSASNAANGVGGDTLGGGEVLDFNLYNTNPQGFLGITPTASADGMYLKFDGVGSGEDLIIILKLYDTVTGEYTTRALMVQNSDIQKGPGNGPSIYGSIVLDNNDGLIVIESNDYNSGGSHYVIIGAQIADGDEGISGTAINFNNAIGVAGASTGTQAFSTDVNDGPIKISDIGFVVTSTTAQSAQLTFNVTVQDADGDTASQTLVVNVGSAPPIALDLNGDGVHFLAASAGVAFDYAGNGSPVGTAWIDKNDGLLAIDLNGNGKVDNGAEIVFGNATQSDLQGLATQYDSNGDGQLSAADAAFAKFGVWQDANSNGVSDPGEFKSLGEMGITSISLTGDGVTYTAADGNVLVMGSTTYTKADGSTGIVADVSFATTELQRQAARPAEMMAINAAATGLLAAMALDQTNAATWGQPETAHNQAFLPVAISLSPDVDMQSLPSFEQVHLVAAANTGPAPLASGHADFTETFHDRVDQVQLAGNDNAQINWGDSGQKSGLFDFDNSSHAAMDSLLSVGTFSAGQGTVTTQDLPVLAEALSDATGNHVVDDIVGYFTAGSAAEFHSAAPGSEFALQGLLNSSVNGSGSGSDLMHFNIMQVIDHDQLATVA